MAIIDVVKYESNENEFVKKFPSQDLRFGSQLVVSISQKAFFVKGGQILDEFGSGTTTLKSANIPLLNKLINLPFGGDTPFQAEVWFVNLISKLDNKWGTAAPIQLEDPKYNVIVPVRAFGQFGFSIENPRLFLESLVGNMPDFSTNKVVEYFKGKITTSITSAISKKIIMEGISVLQINVLLDELSEFCKERVKDEFSRYGVRIENFYIMSINVPEDDPTVIKLKDAKDLAARVNIVGRDIYQTDRSFDVLDKASQNSGSLGGALGTGMGLGLGVGLGNVMGNVVQSVNNTNQGHNSQTPPPPPSFSTVYYVLINNQQNGPHSLDNLKLLISQGIVKSDSLFWKEGMAEWGKISDDIELKPLFGSIPPTPPPIPKI